MLKAIPEMIELARQGTRFPIREVLKVIRITAKAKGIESPDRYAKGIIGKRLEEGSIGT
jgi:hypothetical protein